MGYSEDPSMVKVSFWRVRHDHLKWSMTEAVQWTGAYSNSLIHEEFKQALIDHFEGNIRAKGLMAVCEKPYHEHSHPISILVEDWRTPEQVEA